MTLRVTFPTTVCNVRGRCWRCRRGKNRARLLGLGLQPLLQTLARPFSSFGQYFGFQFF